MPLPDPHTVCAELQLDASLLQLHIDLPGGASIAVPQLTVPNAPNLVAQLLAQANAALAPLVPIFRIIEVALALVDFIQAVPGLVLNPSKLLAAIEKLLVKISVVGSLIPQLTIPRTIKTLLEVLIAYLTAMRGQLVALVQQNTRIDLAAELAVRLGGSALDVSVECARVSVNVQLDAINQGLRPLNELLGLVNLLAGLAGLPKVPTALDLGVDPGAALVPLDAAISALTTLRRLIPTP